MLLHDGSVNTNENSKNDIETILMRCFDGGTFFLNQSFFAARMLIFLCLIYNKHDSVQAVTGGFFDFDFVCVL